jgi:hypothetical protein
MADRYMSIVDAHVILRREGKILLLRRASTLADEGAGGQRGDLDAAGLAPAPGPGTVVTAPAFPDPARRRRPRPRPRAPRDSYAGPPS